MTYDVPYQDEKLLKDLRSLPPKRRAVFAAMCAERLLPLYRRSQERSGEGDERTLERVVAEIWSHLSEEGSVELQRLRDVAESLLPPGDEEAPAVDVARAYDRAYAEDAVAAVYYTIECLQTGDPQTAAWSASRVREAIDSSLVQSDGIIYDGLAENARIERHPRFQAELNRERRDVLDLARIADDQLKAALQGLQNRAHVEGEGLLADITED